MQVRDVSSHLLSRGFKVAPESAEILLTSCERKIFKRESDNPAARSAKHPLRIRRRRRRRRDRMNARCERRHVPLSIVGIARCVCF